MNLTNTIIPKSDQLNADDLISGPRTLRITAVESGTPEQPVSIRYEGDNGRPYKPSKSMRRVLVQLWGSEGAAYIGRRITIYRDPGIKFGGDAVGGIRISHASDINQPLTMALTEKRGSRKPFRVDPLPVEKVIANATQAQAGAPDASLDDAIWAAQEVGQHKAQEGTEVLKEWFLTLSPAVKKALRQKLDEEWKPIAADVDANTKGAI
jgi:hypothetical protein